MPADRFPVVFERGTVEIEVLFLGDFLRITTGAYVREGSGIKLQNLPGPDGWLGVGVNPLIDGDRLGFRDRRLL